jgi:arylsulfatase A-like enzyme
MEWLENNWEDKFFLFLHTYETHHPYTPKRKYLKLFESNYNGTLPEHISVELIKQINKGKIKINDEDKKHIINAYDAEIRSMDDSFGVLIDFLKERKLYEKTLIIFTSDHGEEFGEHGIWATHSHSLFKELVLVPLIIKLPQSKFASRKVNDIVRSIDILPTVMDLLDEKMLDDFEGISLVPLMKGQRPGKELLVISQIDMPDMFAQKYWSIMNRKWKLYNSKLYDLVNDPAELVDVSASNVNLTKRFERFAVNFIKQNKTKFSKKQVKPDKTLEKKLKSLGYLD